MSEIDVETIGYCVFMEENFIFRKYSINIIN